MKHTPEQERFLRAAVKAGLRMQDRFLARPSAQTGEMEMLSEGVATIQRIRTSLRKRNSRTRKSP